MGSKANKECYDNRYDCYSDESYNESCKERCPRKNNDSYDKKSNQYKDCNDKKNGHYHEQKQVKKVKRAEFKLHKEEELWDLPWDKFNYEINTLVKLQGVFEDEDPKTREDRREKNRRNKDNDKDGKDGKGDKDCKDGKNDKGDKDHKDGKKGKDDKDCKDGKNGKDDKDYKDGKNGKNDKGHKDGKDGKGDKGHKDGKGDKGHKDGKDGKGDKGYRDGKDDKDCRDGKNYKDNKNYKDDRNYKDGKGGKDDKYYLDDKKSEKGKDDKGPQDHKPGGPQDHKPEGPKERQVAFRLHIYTDDTGYNGSIRAIHLKKQKYIEAYELIYFEWLSNSRLLAVFKSEECEQDDKCKGKKYNKQKEDKVPEYLTVTAVTSMYDEVEPQVHIYSPGVDEIDVKWGGHLVSGEVSSACEDEENYIGKENSNEDSKMLYSVRH